MQNLGLLIIRLGLGVMFMIHGYPKVVGGPEKWAALGAAVKHVGIHIWPTFFGAAAAFSEFIGGFLLILGVLFQPACACLALTMFVAASYHLGSDHGFGKASHPIALFFVFVGLFFIGSGQYGLSIKVKRGLN